MSDPPQHVVDTGKLSLQNKQEHGHTVDSGHPQLLCRQENCVCRINTDDMDTQLKKWRHHCCAERKTRTHGWLIADPPTMCRQVACVWRVNTAVQSQQMWTHVPVCTWQCASSQLSAALAVSHTRARKVEETIANTETWK